MSTRRQRAASRANAQKSTGPRTEAGKAASRYNALKHGIDAQHQIMFGESAEDLAQLAAEYHELHRPANADERFLVDSMINYEWRLRRLRGVEADLWLSAAKVLHRKNDPEIDTCSLGNAITDAGPAFDRLQRIINSCERHYHHARKQLQALVAAGPARSADPQPAPQPEESTTASELPASFHTIPETTAAAPPPHAEFMPPIAAEAAKPLWQR
jgi:hypothetical protein